jgi:pimeloyl-ACP methyl ester carboxylesterase
VHGEADRLCPASRHALMHELMPQSRYAVIERAGHLLTLEKPMAVNALLRDWLKCV